MPFLCSFLRLKMQLFPSQLKKKVQMRLYGSVILLDQLVS